MDTLITISVILVFLLVAGLAGGVGRMKLVDPQFEPATREEVRTIETELHQRVTDEITRVDGKIEQAKTEMRASCGACSADVREQVKTLTGAVARLDERGRIHGHQLDEIGRKLDRIVERSRHFVTAREGEPT